MITEGQFHVIFVGIEFFRNWFCFVLFEFDMIWNFIRLYLYLFKMIWFNLTHKKLYNSNQTKVQLNKMTWNYWKHKLDLVFIYIIYLEVSAAVFIWFLVVLKLSELYHQVCWRFVHLQRHHVNKKPLITCSWSSNPVHYHWAMPEIFAWILNILITRIRSLHKVDLWCDARCKACEHTFLAKNLYFLRG